METETGESTWQGEPKKMGGKVLPLQRCSCFSPRRSITQPRRECWYCRYADFHLTEPVALKVGVCRWPEIQCD